MFITMPEGLTDLFEGACVKFNWQATAVGFGCGSAEYEVDGVDLATIHDVLCQTVREQVNTYEEGLANADNP